MATMSQEEHRFRDFYRLDPQGQGRARCWCGWLSEKRWLIWVARADHAEHQREMALKI
jgi:hypothetical protein